MKLDWKTQNETVILKILEDTLSHPDIMPEFESALTHAVKPGGKLLLDLSHVTFMNSYAIRAILVGYDLSRTSNAQFCLCAVRSEIMLAFRVLQIATLIPIYADRAEALEAMEGE